MKFFLIVGILSYIFSFNGYAVTKFQTANISCKLPKNERLVIGCTTNCGRFNSWALRRYARYLGYKIKLVNLRSNKQSIDYTKVDGILIPGGVDINPKYYIDNVDEDMRGHIEGIKHLAKLTKNGEVRDQFEFNLLNEYFADNNSKYQPILGICRGMQVLTVSQGIPLYVDIKKEIGIKNRQYTLDRVKVTKPDSLIKEVVGRSNFRAVELHHQGLHIPYFDQNRDNWPHLDVTAVSNKNRIAEALEFFNRPILGVQFHPEYTFGSVRRGIFKWLLKRACINKKLNSKKQR